MAGLLLTSKGRCFASAWIVRAAFPSRPLRCLLFRPSTPTLFLGFVRSGTPQTGGGSGEDVRPGACPREKNREEARLTGTVEPDAAAQPAAFGGDAQTAHPACLTGQEKTRHHR